MPMHEGMKWGYDPAGNMIPILPPPTIVQGAAGAASSRIVVGANKTISIVCHEGFYWLLCASDGTVAANTGAWTPGGSKEYRVTGDNTHVAVIEDAVTDAKVVVEVFD